MQAANQKIKVLFLCTGNSCRSQMAEGWARRLKGDVIEPYSAGIETHGLNPNAVKVMAEAGVDISGHRSKHLDELTGHPVRLCRDGMRPRERELPCVSRQGQARTCQLRRSSPAGEERQDRTGSPESLPSRARRDSRVRGKRSALHTVSIN